MIHGVDPLLAGRSVLRFLPVLLRRNLDTIAKFCVVGSFLRGFASSIGCPASSVEVIGNGTFLPNHYPQCLQALPLHGSINLLSVSNLVELKGIQDLLDALFILKNVFKVSNWRYKVVGDGHLFSYLSKRAYDLGMSDQVIFAGRLDRFATLAEMDQCDIFCLPSWAEAFGIVYLEAMARGKVVIGCSNCGPSDYITHMHDGILVAPRSPHLLATYLLALWNFPSLTRHLSHNALETASRMTWYSNLDRLADVFGAGLPSSGRDCQ